MTRRSIQLGHHVLGEGLDLLHHFGDGVTGDVQRVDVVETLLLQPPDLLDHLIHSPDPVLLDDSL